MYRDENRNIFWSKFFMKARTVFIYFVLIVLSLLCIFTLYVLVINSTRDHFALQRGFNPAIGTHIAHNYSLVFAKSGKGAAGPMLNIDSAFIVLKNSFIIALFATFCSVYFSTIVAYGIHMYRFKLRNAAFTFILVIMMIPTQVSTTGFVSICYQNGWINNFLLLIIPSIASPVTFFYIKQYMESVLPFEMVEAARVDGAGEIRIFHQIVLPVMKPALAVQIIFAFVTSWNNYFVPQLLLTGSENTTVPIMIHKLYSASDGSKDFGVINAVMVISVLPLIVVYFIFSRYIMKGLTLGAVKG
ncbi:MAG: carbohydrate ABC transporter permease [Acholeplasmatales bacterium]|nr:carbohydrate ABC transporter permease [Acholeplasmatales bacterium]